MAICMSTGRIGGALLTAMAALGEPAAAQPCLPVGWRELTRRSEAMHAVAFDAHRERLILFGGVDSSYRPLEETWEWEPASPGAVAGVWVPLTSAGPAPRAGHSMACDADGQRLVLFGGDNGSPLGDTWVFDSVTATWKQLPTSGPRGQRDTAMTYDSARKRVLLLAEGTVGAELWSLPTGATTWTLLSEGQIASRPRSGMAYDSVRDRVVVYGGGDSTATLEWDGTAWVERLIVSQPGIRDRCRLAYDAARRVTVLFGGADASLALPGSTWEWNGERWTLGATTTVGRVDHALVFDPSRQRVSSIGGLRAGGVFETIVTEWNGTGWTLRPFNLPPSGRSAAAMVYDTQRSRAVFCGRSSAGSTHTETWEWVSSTRRWQERASFQPALGGHGMAYDEATGKTVLFGGQAPTFTAVTREWNGKKWREVSTPGPSARARHAMAAYPTRGRIVLFGGYNGNTLGDTWVYNPQASQWTPLQITGPTPRMSAAMAYDPVSDSIVLHGGQRGDTWVLHIDDAGAGEWRQAGIPNTAPQDGHAMGYDPTLGRLVLIGSDGQGILVLILCGTVDVGEWQPLHQQDGPRSRGAGVCYEPATRSWMSCGGEASQEPATLAWSAHSAPFMSVQPLARDRLAPGGSLLLLSRAGGRPPLSYQWRHDGVPLADGDRISGATTPVLVVSNLGREDVGAYDVRVTNECGEVVSETAMVALCEPGAADIDGDGRATSQDFYNFLVLFFASDPRADFNSDGSVTTQDFFDFLAVYFRCG